MYRANKYFLYFLVFLTIMASLLQVKAFITYLPAKSDHAGHIAHAKAILKEGGCVTFGIYGQAYGYYCGMHVLLVILSFVTAQGVEFVMREFSLATSIFIAILIYLYIVKEVNTGLRSLGHGYATYALVILSMLCVTLFPPTYKVGGTTGVLPLLFLLLPLYYLYSSQLIFSPQFFSIAL